MSIKGGSVKGSIMFIAPSAYRLSGLAIWLDYMDPGLSNLGWDVTIGLVEGPRHHLPGKYLAEHAHHSCYAIKCNSNTQEGRLRAVESAISQVKPDIVITVNMPDAILGAARFRQKSYPNLKIAMAVHGIQPDLYDDIKAYGSLLDGVFCVNRLACKLTVEHCGIDVGKVFYTPCGVKLGKIQDRECGKTLQLAYVGRLEQKQKRIFDLSAILMHLDDLSVPWELKIAGTGPDEEKLRLKMAEQLLDDRVFFLGALQPEQLQEEIFDKSDVLLLTSLWETGPLVIWEAMASGVAVVSSSYVGSGLESALYHDKNALIFPVGDRTEAAKQIRRLWCDHGLYTRIRQAGFRLIEERYSIAVSVTNWERHLEELLKKQVLQSSFQLDIMPSAGRLDRLLGSSIAESVRTKLGSTGPDGGAGGEWPHSHGKTDYWDEKFWDMAEKFDYRGF